MTKRKFNLSNLLYKNISKSFSKANLNNHEKIAKLIEGSSKFLWQYHNGIYRDPAMDALVSKCFSNDPEVEPQRKSEFSIIHIATKLYSIGGHTEFLINLISSVRKSPHILILTSHEGELPARILELVKNNGLRLVMLSPTTLIEKIAALKKEIQKLNGIVLLSTHPNDIVPDAALREDVNIPVVTFNHADHVHWLGASISDIVLNYRNIGKNICNKFRGLNNSHKSFLLPRNSDCLRKDDYYSKDLRIKGYDKVCLTVCAEYKIRPLLDQNFYRFLVSAATMYPNICFIIVGPSVKDFKNHYPKSNFKNVILTGKQDNIDKYLIASDIYLDPFPLTSLMSLYEAISFGLFPIVNPYPLSNVFSAELEFEEILFKDIIPKYSNPEDYYINVLSYIFSNEKDFNLRREELHIKFTNKYNSEIFEGEMLNLLHKCKNIKHQVNKGQYKPDRSMDSILLNAILVNDVDEMFTDFIKLSENIPRMKILFLYLYFIVQRLLIKDRNSIKKPTIFFSRRILKNK